MYECIFMYFVRVTKVLSNGCGPNEMLTKFYLFNKKKKSIDFKMQFC